MILSNLKKVPMTRTLLPKYRPSNGGKIGMIRTSMKISPSN